MVSIDEQWLYRDMHHLRLNTCLRKLINKCQCFLGLVIAGRQSLHRTNAEYYSVLFLLLLMSRLGEVALGWNIWIRIWVEIRSWTDSCCWTRVILKCILNIDEVQSKSVVWIKSLNTKKKKILLFFSKTRVCDLNLKIKK